MTGEHNYVKAFIRKTNSHSDDGVVIRGILQSMSDEQRAIVNRHINALMERRAIAKEQADVICLQIFCVIILLVFVHSMYVSNNRLTTIMRWGFGVGVMVIVFAINTILPIQF